MEHNSFFTLFAEHAPVPDKLAKWGAISLIATAIKCDMRIILVTPPAVGKTLLRQAMESVSREHCLFLDQGAEELRKERRNIMLGVYPHEFDKAKRKARYDVLVRKSNSNDAKYLLRTRNPADKNARQRDHQLACTTLGKMLQQIQATHSGRDYTSCGTAEKVAWIVCAQRFAAKPEEFDKRMADALLAEAEDEIA